jgi:hypothetical protein
MIDRYLIVDGKPFLRLEGDPPANIDKILQKIIDQLNEEEKQKEKDKDKFEV